MITFDDAQTNCQDLTNDVSSGTLTFFQRFLNEGYKYVLNDFGRPNIERTYQATTRTPSNPLVQADRVYQLPSDFLFLKSLVLVIGALEYPLMEEESQEMWDYRTRIQQSGVSSLYFLRPRFGSFSGAEVMLDPIPTVGNTLRIVYEATDKDLSASAVNNTTNPATVTFTQASQAVTANASVFSAGMVGRYIKTTDGDGLWYRIIAYVSATQVTIENYYQGATVGGTGWTVNEAFNLPEEMQQLPVYYAIWHFYEKKKDMTQALKYQQYFESELAKAKVRWATKSRSNVIRSKRYFGRWRAYPQYFPPGGISS